ncbi:MAG: hypothetical protein JO048_15935 [Methylobacteriaceae bacterium]|nr:hypothetical protein [Methylobacteriaceae bacterium]
MSFLKKLFGGAKHAAKPAGEPAAPQTTAEIEHRGFVIRAEPYRTESGQYQTAGRVMKTVDGETREHRFVRADTFGTIEDATQTCLLKGRQIVDQLGDRVFG